MSNNSINKDLILREKLAFERTAMANDRTLLSFLRTSLYFAVGGLSLNSFLTSPNKLWLEIASWILCGLFLIIGILKYQSINKKLKNYKKHIGDFKFDYEEL